MMWCAVMAGCGCKPQSKPPVAAATLDAGASRDAAASADAAEPVASTLDSQVATWMCRASPCPWGTTQSNHAVVWPANAGALDQRLGYRVSAAIYLPAAKANGADIAIETGSATAYAGPPAAVSHRTLATIAAGQALHVTGLADGEVLSVQSDAPFRYRAALHPGSSPPSTPPPNKPPPGTPPPNKPPPGDAGVGRVVRSIAARWRCNKVPGCFSDPWTGAVITWPEWAALQSNGRTGNVSRSVFSVVGEPLYPYMGPWSEGCEVTAEAGTVQVVEWVHGAETWRSTVLKPGESHVIHLVPPENGSLIEAAEGVTSFRVSLRNCTPQRIQP
jgi:hypothetical protein